MKIFKINLIIWQWNVEAAKVLWYQVWWKWLHE